MAGKALNKKNLEALGAEVLAELLMEAVKGDAARQRRVRLALASEQSPREAAADIRKRFAQIRRAQSWISARSQRGLVTELSGLIDAIGTRIGPSDPETGFDLLWALLHLAPFIHARTDDSNGALGEVMDAAMRAIEALSPRLTRDPETLADQLFDALLENHFGAFDGAISALSQALGAPGLAILKAKAQAAMAEPGTLAKEGRDRTLRIILKDIADLQGDVDAWLAQYTSEQLTYHTIAPDAARRLLAAGRPDEALQVMETCLARGAKADRWVDLPEVDTAHFACLEALQREDALRQAMWARFETRLCAETLRRYLSRLPDFEDDDALRAAQARVLDHPEVLRALLFCLHWPAPDLAADVVLARSSEIDGDAYDILTAAADLLEPAHPLAATLLWRAMIGFALDEGRSKRYRHAARHLASCAVADRAIDDWGPHPTHATFAETLRRTHPRKHAFWAYVEG